jgi:hypothetical protein
LRDDAEARAIVGVLRASGSAVKGAYDEAMERPLPAGLRDLFADVQGDAATPTADVVAFRPRRTAIQRLLPLAARRCAAHRFRRRLVPSVIAPASRRPVRNRAANCIWQPCSGPWRCPAPASVRITPTKPPASAAA